MDNREIKFKKKASVNGHFELENEPEEKFQEKTTVDASIKDLLQKQVNHEFENERLYLSMALWCEENGWPQTAAFFNKHAEEEERKHGMMFINHMLKRKMKVLNPIPADSVKREFTDMGELIQDAVDRERETSKMIGKLLQKTIQEGDLAFEIASFFMKEQTEEEQLFNSLLNLYEMCGDSKVDFEMEVMTLRESGKYKLGNLDIE